MHGHLPVSSPEQSHLNQQRELNMYESTMQCLESLESIDNNDLSLLNYEMLIM